MTLRSDYGGALSSALLSARNAGTSLIVTNLAAISADMQAEAAKGSKIFDVFVITTFQPEDLKLEESLWYAYKSGIEFQLTFEEIYGSDVSVELDTSDTNTLKVKLSFTF